MSIDAIVKTLPEYMISSEDTFNIVKHFAEAVASYERERCAQICEDHFMSDGDFCARQIRGKYD